MRGFLDPLAGALMAAARVDFRRALCFVFDPFFTFTFAFFCFAFGMASSRRPVRRHKETLEQRAPEDSLEGTHVLLRDGPYTTCYCTQGRMLRRCLPGKRATTVACQSECGRQACSNKQTAGKG